jgi:hypothetical protein
MRYWLNEHNNFRNKWLAFADLGILLQSIIFYNQILELSIFLI